MLTEDIQSQSKNQEVITKNLSTNNEDSTVIFPDEETIEKELERYRLYLISRHLPDHCVQFIHLS